MNNSDIEKRLLGKGASKDITRYTWTSLTQNGTGKALPKCINQNPDDHNALKTGVSKNKENVWNLSGPL